MDVKETNFSTTDKVYPFFLYKNLRFILNEL